MALQDGNNSVFEKRTGTGAAYILPQSQSIQIYANGIADANERERLRQAALLKRQQELYDTNAKTIGSLKIDDHWSQRSAELQKEYDDLNSYAIDASMKGIDINTDRDFRKRYANLQANAAATKELEGMYQQNYKTFGADPDKFENGIDVLQSIKGVSTADYRKGDFKPQQLRQIYSIADAIKDSNGTIAYTKRNDGTYDTTKVNRSGNVGQAISSLNTPAAKYVLSKNGGDVNGYIEGFPTVKPDGRVYYNTQGKDFEDAVISKLATDPKLPSYLQQKGYDVSTTDAIRKSAIDYAKKQNLATGKYVSDYADTLENRATTDITRVFAAEQNARSRRDQQIQEERLRHDKSKWADEELAARPDAIATNVVTNLATLRTGTDTPSAIRPSTSLAASNVGNAKTPFLPTVVFDSETGSATRNTSPITITGGQMHIKRVINFGGGPKIMDDESLAKLKAGTYKLNGKIVPKNTPVTFEELLYGEERVPPEVTAGGVQTKAATIRKVIIPLTGQALDKKFDKAYDRTQMWEKATSAAKDFDTKFALVKQQLKMAAPNMPEKELEKLAFETAKQY